MSYWSDEGLVLSRIDYSETSIILKVFTKDRGIKKGLVRGGKNKKNIYIYEAGNIIKLEWSGRNENSLGNFRCELLSSNSVLFLSDNLKFSAVLSVLNLIEFSLLENEEEKSLYQETKKLLDNILNQPAWLKNYVFWEILLLERIGFGLQLSKCAVSGTNINLAYVSPKTGNAISKHHAGQWQNRLLILPKFIIKNDAADVNDILNGLKISSKFLDKFALSIGKKLPFTRNHFIDIIKSLNN